MQIKDTRGTVVHSIIWQRKSVDVILAKLFCPMHPLFFDDTYILEAPPIFFFFFSKLGIRKAERVPALKQGHNY